ncbi:hypothetical protein EVAR_3295_1 [Eumeta japonica]|uniref:Uncharacterized protein n=1 Tax=Eumeta variegata TaxID=151549 RepID=A0A4C1SY17_EUMVA|nr:hypothetical protein EVAR_3295_1 [Eumeta japonica]
MAPPPYLPLADVRARGAFGSYTNIKLQSFLVKRAGRVSAARRRWRRRRSSARRRGRVTAPVVRARGPILTRGGKYAAFGDGARRQRVIVHDNSHKTGEMGSERSVI